MNMGTLMAWARPILNTADEKKYSTAYGLWWDSAIGIMRITWLQALDRHAHPDIVAVFEQEYIDEVTQL